MKTIVNVNHLLGLGREGDLLVNIPEDMRFFRQETLGKTVIMGRKTLISFPGARPLKNRINIVLTRDPSLIPEESKEAADVFLSGAAEVESAPAGGDFAKAITPARIGSSSSSFPTVLITAASRDEIFYILSILYGEGKTDDAYIIGGASIYSLFIDDCDTLLVTENDADFEADKYFPDFHSDPSWVLVSEGELKEYEGIHFRFNRYERIRCFMLYKEKGVGLRECASQKNLIPLTPLDKDAEGIVLLTDSLPFAKSFKAKGACIEKTYYVELSSAAADEAISRIKARVTRLSDSSFFVSVKNERYHSVRRLMRPAMQRVVSLKRVSLASIAIDPSLSPGDIRELSKDETARLLEL